MSANSVNEVHYHSSVLACDVAWRKYEANPNDETKIEYREAYREKMDALYIVLKERGTNVSFY